MRVKTVGWAKRSVPTIKVTIWIDGGHASLCPPYVSIVGAKEQTGIAIGVEPVAAGDRVGIGPLHGVETAERRPQHEQRHTRQVKIGQENIDPPKPITRPPQHRV